MQDQPIEPAVPAISYGAKSTGDRHGSIPTQLSNCAAMSAHEGWRLIDEYSEEGVSAYTGNRGPELRAAREHAARLAAEHGRCVLVVQHSDRLSRGAGDSPGAAEHLGEIMFWAMRNNVELRSVQDDSTFQNPLLAFVMGERNAEDSRRKALAVAAGMGRRRRTGLHNGGPRKYGYDYVRDEYERTVPDEPMRPVAAEAKAVQRIFMGYVSGTSTRQLARDLDADGVPPLSAIRWWQGTVAKMLSDPFYAGYVRDGGDLVRGLHEPIISEELWRQAEREREGRRKRPPYAGGRPANTYLFTHGHLRCGRCGAAMIPRTATKRRKDGTIVGKPYERYLCHTRLHNKAQCDQQPLPRAAVDRAVLAFFEEVGLSVEQTRSQLAVAAQQRLGVAREQLHAAEKEQQQAEERLARIRRDYANGDLSARHFEEFSGELDGELNATAAERGRLAAQVTELETRTDAPELTEGLTDGLIALREAIAQAIADSRTVEATRTALRRLFRQFVVYQVGDSYAVHGEVSADAIDGLLPDHMTALRRVMLPFDGAITRGETTAHDGLPITSSAPRSKPRSR